MHARGSIAGLVALGVVTLGVATPPTAEGAPDDTPPTVSLERYGRPLVGSEIQTFYADFLEAWAANFELRWQADDPSGICEQTLARQSYENLGNENDPILGGPTAYTALDPSARSFDFFVDSFNHNRITERFYVRVTDCAGNSTVSTIADVEFDVRQDDSATLDYHRRWQAVADDDYSGGTVHRTRQRTGSVTTTFPGVGPIALVMGTGPNNGQADVYVDGVLQATVDTYAPEARNRVVVWSDVYLGGTHTLHVVNKATRGHPRIDVDAVTICEGPARCIAD